MSSSGGKKVSKSMDENKLCLRALLKLGHAFIISTSGLIHFFTSMNNSPNARSEGADKRFKRLDSRLAQMLSHDDGYQKRKRKKREDSVLHEEEVAPLFHCSLKHRSGPFPSGFFILSFVS